MIVWQKIKEHSEGATYPDHRTKRIAEDEKCEAQKGFHWRYVELILDAQQAGGIDGGANVDRDCEQANLERDEELFRLRPISRVMRIIRRPIDEKVIGAFFLVSKNRSLL